MKDKAYQKDNGDYVENIKEKIIERMAEDRRIHENSKYGELIIQANKVHLYLQWLVLARSTVPSKKLMERLEILQFRDLIGCFHGHAKNKEELNLICSLDIYRENRNRLAHKMFTNKKLSPKECDQSIQLGNNIIKSLNNLLPKITG